MSSGESLDDKLAITRENSIAKEQLSYLEAELTQIHRSLGWSIIKKSRKLRKRLVPRAGIGTILESMLRDFLKNVALNQCEGRSNRANRRPFRTKIAPTPVSLSARLIATGPSATAGLQAHSLGLKVSVIVPNFNHAQYLGERLRCLFDQTYPPHEIIFLDDASTDESVKLAGGAGGRVAGAFSRGRQRDQ